MNKLFSAVVALATVASVVNAECANGCNGHGKCTSYDMCICNRNWQANDCSERVCQFGLAHVDTPKGDLDMSGALTGPDHPVVDNHPVYPYGTTEQFPQMEDSDLQPLTDSAHYYMECSNKGKCDRQTGECACYDGYDGVACQRASCPGFPFSCSGHGTCKSKKQLAWDDSANTYQLWDQHTTMGCQCDKGYSGADCSERVCKHGVDPLYLDDSATIKYSTYDFATLTTATTLTAFNDGFAQPGVGKWAIRFFDAHGEDWLTDPIEVASTCAEVTAALEAIPNNVIPSGSTYCTRTTGTNKVATDFGAWDAQHPSGSAHPYKIAYNLSIWEAVTATNFGELSEETALFVDNYGNSAVKSGYVSTALSGYIYRIKFYGNPGALREPEIELYLDGKRPSLVSSSGKVITKVWTDGQQGESNDHFADHCDKVTVTISRGYATTATPIHYLSGLSSAETALLKACLGNSDFDTSNNVEIYDWDYGSMHYPHLIKLVRSVTVYTDGGYYAAIWWDDSLTHNVASSGVVGVFRLMNPFYPPDAFGTDNYEVYTTKGTFALTSNHSEAIFSFASKHVYITNSTYDTHGVTFDGDISCEVGDNNAYKLEYIQHCLNKTDLFTLLSWDYPQYNPSHINLYTAKRLMQRQWNHYVGQLQGRGVYDDARTSTAAATRATEELHFMTHVVNTDISTNWGTSAFNDGVGTPKFRIYKFFPSTSSTYNYVNECSNRGICQTDTGLCQCFPGYTSDDCSVQNSIAL